MTPMSRAIRVLDYAHDAFARDRFLLRQQHLSINQKYRVLDEAGQPVLFVERPAHLLKNALALLLGFAACGAVIAPAAWLAHRAEDQNHAAWILLGGIVTGPTLGFVIGFAVHPRRHVRIYADQTRETLLLTIRQENKWQLIHARYTLRDASGEVLARFSRNRFICLLRRRWDCHDPAGSLICRAREDSMALALLRRRFGPMFGLLRTNFNIVRGGDEAILGTLNRSFTLLDRYVLDLSADHGRTLDRRIAVALGVLLDTGERR